MSGPLRLLHAEQRSIKEIDLFSAEKYKKLEPATTTKISGVIIFYVFLKAFVLQVNIFTFYCFVYNTSDDSFSFY